LRDDNVLIWQRKFFRRRRRTVSPIRQKFVLLISKEILTIRDLLGFSGYRYQLVDFQNSPQERRHQLAQEKTVSGDG
jgi:hypothetical protein